MNKRILAVAFAALLPAAATADIGYSWVQAQAFVGDFSSNISPDFDAAGIGINASFSIGDHFFIQVDDDAMVMDDGADFMVSGIGGSFGFHFEFGDSFGAYIKGGLRTSVVEDDFAEYADDSGTEIGAGIIFKPADFFELNARYSNADLGDIGTRDVVGVGMVFMFGDHFGMVLGYNQESYSDFLMLPGVDADITTYGGGLRFAW
jgi:hypothetical protein